MAARSAGAAAAGKSTSAAAASAGGESAGPPGAGKVAADIEAVKTHGSEHAGHGDAAAGHGMGATAFAAGNDVHFANAGNLNATAHEAAHVVQQRGR